MVVSNYEEKDYLDALGSDDVQNYKRSTKYTEINILYNLVCMYGGISKLHILLSNRINNFSSANSTSINGLMCFIVHRTTESEPLYYPFYKGVVLTWMKLIMADIKCIEWK